MTDDATYLATFACGHSRTYPLPDSRDAAFLIVCAAQRVCPECALSDHLRVRATDEVAS